MGTKLAPYANTFMGYLENGFLKTQATYYCRFIDDVFMIWPHPLNDLTSFIDQMSNIHPSIKFTHEHSSEKITFLDTDVHIGPNNHLFVTTYIKSTSKQAYTNANSYHPPGMSKGIEPKDMPEPTHTLKILKGYFVGMKLFIKCIIY